MRVEEIIIADSSPLIALARIGQLPVLRGLAKRVVVPGAVWAEVAGNRVAPGAGEVRGVDWIEVVDVTISEGALLAELDRGEAEAIVLCEREREGLLLLDDLRGRRVAVRRKLRVIGTVGILLRGKKEGLLVAVRPLLEELVQKGIYLDQRLIEAAVLEAGEK